ncbi:MAG: DNA repair protein RecO, partial [Planctomycetota bacterium]
MPPLHTTGICLRQWPFSETSQTVSILTLDRGLVRGLAKGARRMPGSFGGGFEPLTMGTLIFFHKAGRELETLSEWQESKSWRTPRRNAQANRAALAMVDLAEKLNRGAEVEQDAFWALHNGLDAMEMGCLPDEALCRTLWLLLQAAGFGPFVDERIAPNQAAFDPEAGQLCDFEANAGAWRLSPGTVKVLQSLVREDDELSHEPEAWAKSARLLAAWSSRILGEAPPSW